MLIGIITMALMSIHFNPKILGREKRHNEDKPRFFECIFADDRYVIDAIQDIFTWYLCVVNVQTKRCILKYIFNFLNFGMFMRPLFTCKGEAGRTNIP